MDENDNKLMYEVEKQTLREVIKLESGVLFNFSDFRNDNVVRK